MTKPPREQQQKTREKARVPAPKEKPVPLPPNAIEEDFSISTQKLERFLLSLARAALLGCESR